ncbi:hypothetical protein ONE63_002760 [Megalurothrips usitatus]|uniref:Uncharacterized protein n=2 Tax=Megalurothrips usitatus TaxID=439358 RepID=A0AAV7X555_9NEOP|nr:hypothetical protein ONE63_002760 [Megalurothrips usitatus]
MKFLAVLALILCCVVAALASGSGSKRPSDTDHSKSFLHPIGSHVNKKIGVDASKPRGNGNAFFNVVRGAQKKEFLKKGGKH